VPGAADHHQRHHHLFDDAGSRDTPLRKHFKNKSPGTAEILMTVWDAAYRSAAISG